MNQQTFEIDLNNVGNNAFMFKGDDTIGFIQTVLLEGSSWSTAVLTVRRRIDPTMPRINFPTSVLSQSPNTISSSSAFGYYDLMGVSEFGVEVTTASAARLIARITIRTEGYYRLA